MPIAGSAMYEINGRKYVDIDGIRIKVPWRYNRITGVDMKGIKTLHELKAGDFINQYSFETKTWNGETFYVLKSIDF